MRNSGNSFTHKERMAALLALVGAAVVAIGGLTLDRTVLSPSLGPQGASSYSVPALPGVLDARPVG